MTIAKVDNWESLLWAEVNRMVPFEWGFRDCALFVADCALAMTGHDFAAPARGAYADEGEAKRYMAAMGARNLVEFADAIFSDLEKIDPEDAMEGDLLVVETPVGNTGAVHTGGIRIAMVSEDGVLLVYGGLEIKAAFRIP